MKTRLLLTALFLAVAANAESPDVATPPELAGILVTGKTQRFALVASGGQRTGWAAIGDTFEGWKLLDYRPDDDAVVLGAADRKVTVRLNTAAVGEADFLAAPKATLADADEVLTKMKFEAMWDIIAAEQKKAIVGGMRQQVTAEFTKVGLPAPEIEVLLDRMGEAVVGGLQTPEMKQDFARIYSEVYTKDELRGMADFCDTVAGRAWSAKQPEVQQKLMQAMMPRVMQGMPAAQKAAMDYMQNRVQVTAPKPPGTAPKE